MMIPQEHPQTAPRSPSFALTLTLTLTLTLGLLACAGAEPAGQDAAIAPDPRLSPLLAAAPPSGKKLFETAIPGSNGRTCATCHVLEEDTTLLPASVAARLQANPKDPLFHRLDADDPEASTLTFEHLKKGLVRVVLPLPANMDVVDLAGNVVTPADRKIFVWRGVPTVANTALTAPYQFDGRERTLPEQAQAAITNHSEGPKVPDNALERVADFQRGVFTSNRARLVSLLLDFGMPLEKVPTPEQYMTLSLPEKRGREIYKKACDGCHGSATTDRMVNRKLHEFLTPVLKPDGNVLFEVKPGVGPVPVRQARPGVEIFNVGFGMASYFGQLGLFPAFNASVSLPRYRFRFYKDGTRSEKAVDLPPVPVTVSGDPNDPRPALDERGAPIVGPNLTAQLFTTDPGRAAITGDPLDFEAFDVPQLRGIARTAPYFHDNSAETLRDVLDGYSRFFLHLLPPLNLPKVHPPETTGGPKEALTLAEKDDLIAFLQRL